MKKLLYIILTSSLYMAAPVEAMGYSSIVDALKVPTPTLTPIATRRIGATCGILAASYIGNHLSKWIVSDGQIRVRYEIVHGRPSLVRTNYDEEAYNALTMFNVLATLGALALTWQGAIQ